MSISSQIVGEVASQSNPRETYVILCNQDNAGHKWLSCPCGSWTRGRYQTGKPIYERYCKHTDRARIQYRQHLQELGFLEEPRLLSLGGLSNKQPVEPEAVPGQVVVDPSEIEIRTVRRPKSPKEGIES